MAAPPKDDPRIAFMMRALETPPVAYKLAGLLCWKYGNKTGAIFPAQETLARDLGVTARYVRDVLKEQLVPIGLKISIRRGPRKGTTKSFYSFGDPGSDGAPIPELGNLNTRPYSGTEKPKSPPYSGTGTTPISELQCGNSGTTVPPNQQRDPKGGTKREGAQARASLSEPPFDSNLEEAKNGEILPPENQPGRPKGKPRPLPPDWQPSDEDWAYASKQGLSGDDIEHETQRFRDWVAHKGISSSDWPSAWRRFVGNSRQNKRNRPQTLAGRARERVREAETIEAIMVMAGADPTDQAAYQRFEAEWQATSGTDADLASLMAKAAAAKPRGVAQ